MTTVVRTHPFDAKRIAEESADLDALEVEYTYDPELDARQSMEVIAWLNELGVMNTYIVGINEHGHSVSWLGDINEEA